MSSLDDSLVILLLVIAAVIQIALRARYRFGSDTIGIVSLVLYGAHAGIGLALFALLAKAAPDKAGYLAIALVGWTGVGALDVIRLFPRGERPPPVPALVTPGKADIICLIVMAVGLALAWRQ